MLTQPPRPDPEQILAKIYMLILQAARERQAKLLSTSDSSSQDKKPGSKVEEIFPPDREISQSNNNCSDKSSDNGLTSH